MSYEIKGTVHHVGEENRITDKFANRLLVIHTTNTFKDKVYDKYTAIEFVNNKMEILEGVRAGQELVVKFDIDSREHKGKWYTSAKGFSVEIQVAPQKPITQTTNASIPPAPSDEGELPF